MRDESHAVRCRLAVSTLTVAVLLPVWGAIAGPRARAEDPIRLAGRVLGVSVEFEPERLPIAFRGPPPAAMLTSGGVSVVTCLAYSPDGKTLAVGDSPNPPICTFLGHPPINENGGLVRLLDAATHRVRTTLRPEKIPGHEYGIDEFVFSRDGTSLVARTTERFPAEADDEPPSSRTVFTTWGLADGRVQARVVVPDGGSWSVNAISPDGRWLAAVSDKRIIRIWDARTGIERHAITVLDKLGEDEDGIAVVAFSPDGRILVAGVGACEVRLWESGTARALAHFPGRLHGKDRPAIGILAFSLDGATLAAEGWTTHQVGEENKVVSTVTLYDVAARREVAVLSGGDDANIFSMAFFPDGTALATGSSDGSVRIWETATGKLRDVYKKDESWILSLAFAPDGTTLAAGDRKDVSLWDVTTGRRRADLLDHDGDVTSLAFAPGGRTLASAGRSLKLWDLAAALNSRPDAGHAYEISAVAYAPGGGTLASASVDGTVKLWDLATKRPRATLRGHDQPVLCLAYARDGRTIASGDRGGAVKVWEAGSGKRIAEFAPHATAVKSLAFSPDGRTIATASWRLEAWVLTGDVQLRDATTGAPRPSPERLPRPVEALAYSPDGARLAIGLDDGRVLLRDVATGRSGATVSALNGGADGEGILCLAFSPDGSRLAAGSADHTVKLWDVTGETPRLEGQLKHEEYVVSLAFAPDGKFLAASDRAETLKVWDVAGRSEVASAEAAPNWFTSVAFSPDGTSLAAGNRDASIRIWDFGRILATRRLPW